MDISPNDLDACLRVLQAVADDPTSIDHDERFKGLVAKIYRASKKHKRQLAHAQSVERDRAKADQTGIVQQQFGQAVLPALVPETTQHFEKPHYCYVCKHAYTAVHFFYHALCPPCASRNWSKRHQQADLTGRTALVTGGRIKIGYHTVLKLLRDGARVLLTTRFPEDAAKRYAKEADASRWSNRLEIYGLELRDLFAVEQFAKDLLSREPALDIIIHNAAQTVKRPLAFYRHLLDAEVTPTPALAVKSVAPMLLETRPNYRGHIANTENFFPLRLLDRDGQQVDQRPNNSWRQKLGAIDTIELLEVLLVNTVAPFVLDNALLPLLARSPHTRRFIVHVSAMEGQFARPSKTAFHPHTNMAKAALNMLTRTTATDLAMQGIYINSVDTGWITDEKPLSQAEYARDEQGFRLPLDAIDGAARVYDPVASGVNEPAEPLHGHFLKDYAPYPW